MASGNCKISARARGADPCFCALIEAAIESKCPAKKGSISLEDQTSAIFVFRLGKTEGSGIEAIRQFTCYPPPWYLHFLKILPEAMDEHF